MTDLTPPPQPPSQPDPNWGASAADGGQQQPPPPMAPGYQPAPPQGQQPPGGYPAQGYGGPAPGYGAPPGYNQPAYGGGAPGYQYYPPAGKGGMPTWAKVMLGGCGGCLVLAILFFVFAGVAGNKLTSAGPLATFPKYPGASVTAQVSVLGSAGLTMSTSDSPEQVVSYYQSNLTGTWVFDNVDTASNTITFHKASDPKSHGSITVSTSGSNTAITVAYTGT